jgi:hypothetical protein
MQSAAGNTHRPLFWFLGSGEVKTVREVAKVGHG